MGGAPLLVTRVALLVSCVVANLSCSPAPPARRPRGLTDPNLASACLYLVSCPTPVESRYVDVSECLLLNQAASTIPELPGPRAVRTSVLSWADTGCLASAPGCAAARSCLVDSERCAGLFDGGTSLIEPVCAGNNRVSCSPATSLTHACGAFDSLCITHGGVSACGQFTCADSEPSTNCDGETLVTCVLGFGTDVDCRASGRVCRLVDGLHRCVGGGPACTASRCEGDTLIRCEQGHEWRVSCGDGKEAQTCVQRDGEPRCAPVLDPECDRSTWRDRCAGGKLVICDGAVHQLDCLQFGFTGCAENADGGPGRCR